MNHNTAAVMTANLQGATLTESQLKSMFKELSSSPRVTLVDSDVTVAFPDAPNEADITKMLGRARGMRRKGRDDVAMLLLRLLYSVAPEHPNVNFRLGYYLFKPYPDEQAIPHLEVALERGSERQKVISAAYLAVHHLLSCDRSAATEVLRSVCIGGQEHLDLLVQALEGVRDADYDAVLFEDQEPYPIAHINTATLLHLAGDRLAAEACLGKMLWHGSDNLGWERFKVASDGFEAVVRGGKISVRVGCDQATGLLMLKMS